MCVCVCGRGVGGLGVLVILKNYSIQMDLKNSIDTMVYFLSMFCSLSCFFFFVSVNSLLLFIYLFVYLFE